MKNLIEKINKLKVNNRYMLYAEDAVTLLEHSENNLFILVNNSFLFGYMQGHKAAIAELKKK